MSSILADIVAKRREAIATAKHSEPLAALRHLPLYKKRTPMDVYRTLATAKAPAVIAEFKRKSPSQGELSNLDPVSVTTAYVNNGATMLSVLTEPAYFKGSVTDLMHVRKACPTTPILMKDFVIDPYQVHLARAIGADCILLIMGMIPLEENRALLNLAHSLNLSVLVETHSEDDIHEALKLEPKLLGINCRNLKTMATDLNHLYALRRLIPQDTAVVAESGIHSGNDIKQLLAHNFSSFLIGTSLMKTGAPGTALAQMIQEVRA